MYVIVKYNISPDGDEMEFGLADYCTTLEKDLDDDFADMVGRDFDYMDGLDAEIRRQGGRQFNMDEIDDEDLKEECEEYYGIYIAKVDEI